MPSKEEDKRGNHHNSKESDENSKNPKEHRKGSKDSDEHDPKKEPAQQVHRRKNSHEKKGDDGKVNDPDPQPPAETESKTLKEKLFGAPKKAPVEPTQVEPKPRDKRKTLEFPLEFKKKFHQDAAQGEIPNQPEPEEKLANQGKGFFGFLTDTKQPDEGPGEVKKTDDVKPKDDDTLEYDPEDDVWELDAANPSEGRKYARSTMEAFQPLLLVASILGLFPLVVKRESNGTYKCKFAWFSFATAAFIPCALACVGSTFWFLFSVICASVNIPEHQDTRGKAADIYRSEEIYIYKRNVLSIVIVSCTSIHATVCLMAVFYRRDYIAKQLVYWSEVVELLHLDVGKDVAKSLWIRIAVIGLFGIVIIIIYISNVSPGLASSGSTIYVVFIRFFDPYGIWHSHMHLRKFISAGFLLYIILAGYIYTLWFFFNCRILTNILKIWNNRFEFCLHKQVLDVANENENRETRKRMKDSNRTSRAHLFKDHLVIFNLLEGVNSQFEIIMESYYFSTMVMIVFESYGFVRAFNYHEFNNCGKRQIDIVPISIFLAMQLYMYFMVTLEAAGVADEARHVLDIVRRKGMMTSKADNELWFMMSMRLSFGGHEDVGIIGAGFFYITKAFLLGGISAIMTHFIIFYQFEIPLSQTPQGDANFEHLNVTKLLAKMEGVSDTPC